MIWHNEAMKQYEIIKVNPQGYCGGVLRAINMVKKVREENPYQTITILGNLVHNTYVTKALEFYDIQTCDAKGLTRFDLLDQVNEGIVIFTAHGIHPSVIEKAKQKHLQIVDASCPFVLQTQRVIKEKIDEGYTIFYVGKKGHPEAESVCFQNKDIYLIENEKDIPDNIIRPIFVTNQTTMSIMDLQALFEIIKEKYPNAVIHDEICNATRVRQQAVLDLKNKNVDVLIVVGDPSSNNTNKLAQIGKQANISTVLRVNDVNELHLKDFCDARTIAITSGASTPTYLTDQVIHYLETGKKEETRIQDIL